MLLEAIASSLRSFVHGGHENRYSSLDARIWADLGWMTESSSGVTVNADTSLRVSTVYACVRLLADTIAQLPMSIVRENADGTTDKANDTPIAKVLRLKPNLWQTSFEWRQMMMGHVALRGNAYSLVIPGPMGSADQLIPLNPGRMTVERAPNGRLLYKYQNPNGSQDTFTQDNIFHLRGLSSDGLVGLSPIQIARDNIGLAIAMERHGSSLYKNGARPAAIIKHPGRLNEAAAAKLRERWEHIHAGVDNAGRTAVLEEGMDVTTLGMTAEDAQYIASREFQLSEIARMWRIPLHLIQDTRAGAVGYASVEQLSLSFVKFTLGPWLRTWEEAVKRDLIGDDALYLKFNLNALLRGDTTARGQFYQQLSSIGVFSPNDIRELEDLDPVEGGDQRFIPLNLIPLELASDKALNDMKPEPAPEPPAQALPAPVPEEPPPPEPARELPQQKLIEYRSNIPSATYHCLAIMMDFASRMIRREVAAVQGALKKDNFIEAIDKFYSEHSDLYASTMRSSCDLYHSLTGVSIPTDEIVSQQLDESKQLLLEAAGRATPKTLADEVNAVIKTWPDRASRWTMIGDTNNGHRAKVDSK